MATPRYYRSSSRRLTETLGTSMYVIDSGLLEAGLVSMIISQFDYPYTVLDSAESLQAAINSQPLPMDLVVVDLSLDESPGLEMVERLRQRAPASSILVVKALLREETDLGVSLGVYAHTPRPMVLGEFTLGLEAS